MTYAIAIDGPAGAGKGTIAKALSTKLGIPYLDTGAMYRAVALKIINLNIDSKDVDSISNIIDNIKINVKYINKRQHTFLDGADVTDKIRTKKVTLITSDIAKIRKVRIKLMELQREIAKYQSVIMDGRDIGTYVLPDADYKFYITATAEERAKRRFLQLKSKGETEIEFNEVLKNIKYRDKVDSSRKLSPLKKAKDAILIDTTDLNIEEVVNKLISYIKFNMET